MTLSRIKSIYEISKLLWGGHLAPLTPHNSRSSLNHFCNIFDDVNDDIVRLFFVIAHQCEYFFTKNIKPLASHFNSKIGIGFSFSPPSFGATHKRWFLNQKDLLHNIVIN